MTPEWKLHTTQEVKEHDKIILQTTQEVNQHYKMIIVATILGYKLPSYGNVVHDICKENILYIQLMRCAYI